MAPISPDNTQRFYVDYTVAEFQHTLLCRANSDVTASDAGATMAAFFAAHGLFIYATTIDGFRSSAPGSSITVPETWPGALTYGAGPGPRYASAYYYDYVGRGATGHRARAALFGAVLAQQGNDFRITPAEAAFVGDALAVLRSDVEIFLDIDYEVPVWHDYANCGPNAYWRNKIR